MLASVPLAIMSESYVIGPFTVSVKFLGIEYHMGDKPSTQCDRTCCLTNNIRKSHTLHVHVPVIDFLTKLHFLSFSNEDLTCGVQTSSLLVFIFPFV